MDCDNLDTGPSFANLQASVSERRLVGFLYSIVINEYNFGVGDV